VRAFLSVFGGERSGVILTRKQRKRHSACMTDELAPRLLAALKKLDEERPEFVEHVQPVRETKIEWVGGEIAHAR